MGATIGNLFGEWFHLGWKNSRVLLAAARGRGSRRPSTRRSPGRYSCWRIDPGVRASHRDSAIGASATAISVSQAILGTAPDFHVGKLAVVGAEVTPLFFLFGVIAGGAAALYCEALLGVMSLAQSLDRRRVGLYARSPERWSARWRGWRRILSAARRDNSIHLLGTQPLAALLFVFFFRFAFGAVSTPQRRPGNIRANARFGRAARVDLRANLSVHFSGP